MDVFELLKFFASSLIGGIIGGWISFRLYIAQKRFDFKQQDDYAKREALREMLPLLPIIYRDVHLNWEMPEDSKETSKEHVANIEAKISRWRSLFIGDEEVLSIIREFASLVGMSKHGFYGQDNRDVKKPGQIIADCKEAIEVQIKRLDKLLTGRI
jgi:hypothetical protein